MPQAAPRSGQPRPISRLGRAGRPYRPRFPHRLERQRREFVAEEGRRSALLLLLAHLGARAAARELEVAPRRADLTDQLREADGSGGVPCIV
eukprot:scaffold163_cov69-Phaeocystis_antarctica.AAC.3